MASSTAKVQLQRGPSQLGKWQRGLGTAPALSRPARPHSHRRQPDSTPRGACGKGRTHGTCGTAGPGVLGEVCKPHAES